MITKSTAAVLATLAFLIGIVGGTLFGSWTENNRLTNAILSGRVDIHTNHVPYIVITN